MPKLILPFDTIDAVPASLKPYYNSESKNVEVFAGGEQTVAAELNPGLEKNRNELKAEKDKLAGEKATLEQSVANIGRELQTARAELATAQAAKGASPEDLALAAAVKAADPNIKPEDIGVRIKEYPELKAATEKANHQTFMNKAFELSGFKNQKVFETIANAPTLNPGLEKFSVEKNLVEGKEVDTLFALVKNADGTVVKTPFAEYAKANEAWGPFLPSLNESNTQWIPQNGGAQPAKEASTQAGGALGAFISAQNKNAAARSNPLNPAQPGQSQTT